MEGKTKLFLDFKIWSTKSFNMLTFEIKTHIFHKLYIYIFFFFQEKKKNVVPTLEQSEENVMVGYFLFSVSSVYRCNMYEKIITDLKGNLNKLI